MLIIEGWLKLATGEFDKVADAARASPVSGARRVEVTYDERGVLTGGQIVEDVTALRDAAGSLVGITTGGDR
jgi:hypothetical protein